MRWDGYQMHRWRGPVKRFFLQRIAHNYWAYWCGWTIIGCSGRQWFLFIQKWWHFFIWAWVICVKKCPCVVTYLHLLASFANDDHQKSNFLPTLNTVVFSVAMTLANSSSRLLMFYCSIWPIIGVISVAPFSVILVYTTVWVLMVL